MPNNNLIIGTLSQAWSNWNSVPSFTSWQIYNCTEKSETGLESNNHSDQPTTDNQDPRVIELERLFQLGKYLTGTIAPETSLEAVLPSLIEINQRIQSLIHKASQQSEPSNQDQLNRLSEEIENLRAEIEKKKPNTSQHHLS